jgi:hypothetical protein
MNQVVSRPITLLGLAFSAFFLSARPALATDISGTISTTVTITDDSELVGDVTCMVSGAPCIAFGASDTTLRLNGFTISGSSSDCTASTATDGIDVTGVQDVAILGPGLIEKFAFFGIALRHATNIKVAGITAADNCFSGIFLSATTGSNIEKNLSVRNSMHSRGNPCGGT